MAPTIQKILDLSHSSKNSLKVQPSRFVISFPSWSILTKLVLLPGTPLLKIPSMLRILCSRAPATVFKLDFRKAFDSLSWEALDRILLAKGFPPLARLDQAATNSCNSDSCMLSQRTTAALGHEVCQQTQE
jgi:hypothetical protein